MPGPRRFRRARGALVAALCSASLAVPAQEQIGLRSTEPLDLEPVVDEDSSTRTWQARIGLLGAYGPEYTGADEYDFDAVPLLRVTWKGRVVFRGRSLDVNIYRDHGVRLGPMLKTRAGRNENKDRILEGSGDVDRAYEAGGFVRFRQGPANIRINALQDVADGHNGFLVEMSAGVRLPLDDPLFSLTVSSAWADDNYMSSYFGVNAGQAARSRLRPFAANAGFTDVRVAVGTRVDVDRHWSAVLSFGYERLLDDAADSPIVADHGTANQVFGALGAMYRF